MKTLKTDILVVGGGTGGTAAAIQAARRGQYIGLQVTLVSDYSWLGGMLTAAGVSAPDGNELRAFQTGLWGQFVQAIHQRQRGGVDHGWVSCFTYDPQLGAAIFAEWAAALPNLQWIAGQRPVAVQRQGDRLTAVTFDSVQIQAQLILDGTELGDVLALADVPHRWGWDGLDDATTAYAGDSSAPHQPNRLTQTYPVQLPTWVVVMQDFGAEAARTDLSSAQGGRIPASPLSESSDFSGAWEGYGAQRFLDYGRLPGDRFMINWPQCGNDYGHTLNRLVESDSARVEWLQEARWHTQAFARHIQTELGPRYGLAPDVFPQEDSSLGGGAYALQPYYRESRRVQGLRTITEVDLLPVDRGWVASLPLNDQGEVEAIAIGNYANDHHYPAPESALLTVQPKSMIWGGRWTGTPFTIPYRSLVPATVEGLLVCEKNISVSHIANGATRLQPVVMNIGQAAGMAAALCLEQNCAPRDLPVRSLQEALLTDAIAPAAVIPLLNCPPQHPHWEEWQRYYLDHGDQLPPSGEIPDVQRPSSGPPLSLDQTSVPATPTTEPVSDGTATLSTLTGRFHRRSDQRYSLLCEDTTTPWPLITLCPSVHRTLQHWPTDTLMTVSAYANPGGPWLRVVWIETGAESSYTLPPAGPSSSR